MRKFLIASAGAIAAMIGLASPAMAAGGGDVKLQTGEWSFTGPFGYFDKAALQRGFQVYREVCAGCHGLDYICLLYTSPSPRD